MNDVPLIIITDWLAERLGDPKLQIVDAAVYMKFPEGGGPPNVESGKDSYEQGHFPEAVYADLVSELSGSESNLPFTATSREAFIKKMTELSHHHSA